MPYLTDMEYADFLEKSRSVNELSKMVATYHEQLSAERARAKRAEALLRPFADLMKRIENWSKETGEPIPRDDQYSPELRIAMACIREANTFFKEQGGT